MPSQDMLCMLCWTSTRNVAFQTENLSMPTLISLSVYKLSSVTMPLVLHSSTTTCISSHETPCRDSKSACPSGECHGFKPWRSSARFECRKKCYKSRVYDGQMIIYGSDSASLRPLPGNPTCLESLESLESMGCVSFGKQKLLVSAQGSGIV